MSIKSKMSGPAIFMHSVIIICIIISIVCFYFYYGDRTDSKVVLYTGVVTFTIMYHFWVRIIMGNVSKLFRNNINYNQKWFKEHKFEKPLYDLLKVKKWKDKALTYNPGDFDLKEKSLEDIANIMAKSEVDHWINELISISTMFFSFIWPKLTIAFILSAIAAMIFDSQFILIQRYNRPRIVKALERKMRSEENNNSNSSDNNEEGKDEE